MASLSPEKRHGFYKLMSESMILPHDAEIECLFADQPIPHEAKETYDDLQPLPEYPLIDLRPNVEDEEGVQRKETRRQISKEYAEFKGHCRKCGKEGHMIEFCRAKKYRCFFCKKTGHFSNRCYRPNKALKAEFYDFQKKWIDDQNVIREEEREFYSRAVILRRCENRRRAFKRHSLRPDIKVIIPPSLTPGLSLFHTKRNAHKNNRKYPHYSFPVLPKKMSLNAKHQKLEEMMEERRDAAFEARAEWRKTAKKDDVFHL